MSMARYFIFVAHDHAKGLDCLDGVISNLGEQHQKALSKLHQTIRRGSMTNGPKIDVRAAFQEVNSYLAKTHYCDYQIGTIPTSTLQKTEEVPEGKISERVASKI